MSFVNEEEDPGQEEKKASKKKEVCTLRDHKGLKTRRKIKLMKDVKSCYTKEEKSKLFEQCQEIMKMDKFFIGRVGHNEINLCGFVITNGNINDVFGFFNAMRNCAGIHISNPDSLSRYVNAYMQAVHNCNMIGTMKADLSPQIFYDWCADNLPDKYHLPACCLEA